MSRRQAAFSVDRWEYVPGDGGIALLRLAGEWQGGDRPSPKDAELLLEGDDGVIRHSALPDPTAETAGLGWRAAFAVDARATGSSAAYRLSVPGYEALDLPQPVERGAPKTTERRRSLAEIVRLGSLRGPQQRQAAGDPAAHQAAPSDVQTQADSRRVSVRELQARIVDLTESLELERSARSATAESERRLVAELSRAEKELRKALAKAERRGVKMAALGQELSRAKEEQGPRSRRRVEALTRDLARSKAELKARGVQLSEKDYAQARLEQELARFERRAQATAESWARERRSLEAVRARLEEELESIRSDREELAGSLEELRVEHVATVEALVVSRREGEGQAHRQAELERQLQEALEGRREDEARRLELTQELESERSALGAAAERLDALEAELRRREGELEQASSTCASLTLARDEADSRAAGLGEALVESDARAVSLREAREELAGSLEQLRLEHMATVEALAASRRRVEELADRQSELEAELEAERSAVRVMSEQVQDLDAERTHSLSELEGALSKIATLTQGRHEANLRAAVLERALAESDGEVAAGFTLDAARLADGGVKQDAALRAGEGSSTLELLRAEAVRGQERAAMIEGRAVSLLEEIATSV